MQIYKFTAFPDSENQRNNLQEILDKASCLPEYSYAHVKLSRGVYSGQFFFDGNKNYPGKRGVSLVVEGCGIGKTVISGSLAASEILEDGIKRGTFRTYTAFFSGPRVELRKLTIENTSGLPPPEGIGEKAMQGIALYAAAEQFYCKKIELSGHQDTLFLAPLPAAEREKGGFRGPGEFALRKPTFQFYEKCIVSGTVDFVFGGAASLFKKCKFIVRKPPTASGEAKKEKKYYVAAPCADSPFENEANDTSSGFFFKDCSFSVENCDETDVSVYLARPWRPYGRCFFTGCRIGKGFSPEMWHIWNNEEDKSTAGFYLCGKNKIAGTDVYDWGTKLSLSEKHDLFKKIEKESCIF